VALQKLERQSDAQTGGQYIAGDERCIFPQRRTRDTLDKIG
jgi:hypothetical protein